MILKYLDLERKYQKWASIGWALTDKDVYNRSLAGKSANDIRM